MVRRLVHAVMISAMFFPAAISDELVNEGVHTKSDGAEQTLVLLKPDAVVRGHIGVTIASFEKCGLNIENLKVFDKVPQSILAEHYKEHAGKGFYDELIQYMSSGPVVAIQVFAFCAIFFPRTCPHADGSFGEPTYKAAPGTLRQTYGLDKTRNFAHASDSVESGERELQLWFAAGACPAPA